MQDAFAQTVGGDHDLLEVSVLQQPFQHHGAIGQGFGAAFGDHLHPLDGFARELGHHLAQPQRAGARDRVVLQDMERIIACSSMSTRAKLRQMPPTA